MSDFTIFNPADQTTVTANDGDTVHLYVPIPENNINGAPQEMIWVRAEATQSINSWFLSETDLFTASPLPWTASDTAQKPIICLTIEDFHKPLGMTTEVVVGNGGPSITLTSGSSVSTTQVPAFGKSVRLVIYWVSDGGKLIKPLSWMPANVLDLQWDWNQLAGQLSSASLRTFQGGIESGATVTLAVVPSQAGSFITSGITALAAVVRCRPGSLPLAQTSSSGTFTTVSSNGYFGLSLPLASAALSAVFSDLNNAVLQAQQAGNAGNVPAATAAAQSLSCLLELTATHTSGAYASLPFPVTILQSLAP